MMEKAAHPHTFVVALTYNEETEHSRRSARVFDYRDVSDFLKRLRRQMEHHMSATASLSFIAAGEYGDRFKRVHWHVVLFGAVDFITLGQWSAPWGPVTDRADIVSPVGLKDPWRRSWSLWPHGFVTVQEPDYGGMHYAMSYALKDQFNVRNSEGTAREAKAEVFGTGYLAMSKQPPIGARFVASYLADCASRGIVPPSRKLTVPGVRWPFWPSGNLRRQLLEGLAEINAGIRMATGRDAAGWSSLLHEARLSEDDLELLGVYDEQAEGSAEEEWQQIVANFSELQGAKRRGAIRRSCGSSEPCDLCLRGRSDLAAHGIEEVEGGYRREGDAPALNINGVLDPSARFRKRQRDGKSQGPNPLCLLYGDASIRAADFKFIWPDSARCEAEFAAGARSAECL